ncbi:MAG: GDSL-type esterase/lipase family protein [Chitinophagaceae bacterium]|nr:GDSL-type esterase/lipase family protein [Chitinophagaceae bacterium]
MKKLVFLLCIMVFGASNNLLAQPFANEIAAFKRQDSLKMPPRGAILFVGSSSFRLWKDLEQRFPKKNIINRGFGGSALPDVKRYLPDIVYPYEPSKIVMYCGENDFTGAGADTVSAQTVYERFVDVYLAIRVRYPLVPFTFISIKPSPSRRHLLPKMAKANELIRQYLRYMPHARFVDVYAKMLDKKGNPLPELFTGDSLHMNAKGYDIWQKALKKHL